MSIEAEPLVRFGRNERGRITMHVPESYRPILWVIDDLPTWAWPEILHHAHHPSDEEYITGGNAYLITIDRHDVLIEDDLDERTLATLPHRDFITLVEGYLAELDRWYAERGITTEQRRDLYHRTYNPSGKPYHQL